MKSLKEIVSRYETHYRRITGILVIFVFMCLAVSAVISSRLGAIHLITFFIVSSALILGIYLFVELIVISKGRML